jgi:hypothetical protein
LVAARQARHGDRSKDLIRLGHEPGVSGVLQPAIDGQDISVSDAAPGRWACWIAASTLAR